jgi:hypothetical protein
MDLIYGWYLPIRRILPLSNKAFPCHNLFLQGKIPLKKWEKLCLNSICVRDKYPLVHLPMLSKHVNVNCLLIVALGWAHKHKYVDATSRCIIVSIGEIIPLQQSKILPQNCFCVRDDNSPFAHVIMLQCPITADVFPSWHVIINIIKNFPSPCLQ